MKFSFIRENGASISYVGLILVIAFFKKGNASCDDLSCEFGAICQDVGGSRKCVCPDLPCQDSEKEMAVCGANGQTYLNMCDFQQTMCKTQTFINIGHLGKCGEQLCTSKWECIYEGDCIGGKCVCVECRDVIDRRIYYQSPNSSGLKRTSVCGTDGVTYESECHLKYHSCVAKRLIFVTREGVCHSPKLVAPRESKRSGKLVQRSVIVERLVENNCSVLRFSHCVSPLHPRLRYMGEFIQVPGKLSFGSPVYKLRAEGSATDSKTILTTSRSTRVTPVFLSRFVSPRLPNGSWIVGSKVGSGKGWLGSKDPSLTPQDVTNIWKSSVTLRRDRWRKEASLSLHCRAPAPNYECAESFSFDGSSKSLWQPVVPRTPYYTLRVTQTWASGSKRKPKRKIRVEIKSKRKTMRFSAYMLKFSTDRPMCGFPAVAKSKLKDYQVECGGSLIISKVKNKMMRSKSVFRAPEYGCVNVSATILSSHNNVYQDDELTGSVCSDKV